VTGLRRRRPEEEPLVKAGTLLLNRIALALVAEARRGSFGGDEGALLSRAEELAGGFAAEAGTAPTKEALKLTLRPGGRIELSVPCGEGIAVRAEVREDGVVLGGGTSLAARSWSRTPDEFSPEEREQARREELAAKARRGKPEFHGGRWLRTVAAPEQPGAALRILAVEIYDDGFYVDFTYDNDAELERPEEEDSFFTAKPPMEVEDDLGTEYYEGLRASFGGAPISFSTLDFAPTPPAAATLLRITTDSGTAELQLGD
jgi:hypothetical protein